MKDRHDDQTPDLFGGEQRKRAGRQQALDHEAEEWKGLYRHYANRWLNQQAQGVEFQGEKLRAYVVRYIGPPHTPSVWGAMFHSVSSQWLRDERIEFAGKIAAAKATKSNGHVYRLYRKR